MQVQFADLLPQAHAHVWDLDQLVAETGCGAQCGMCRPYLRSMLDNGVTVFHSILPALDPDRDLV